MPKVKTHAQLARIFGLAKRLDLEKADLENLAWELTDGRTERLSSISFDEANKMIVRLGGDPLTSSVADRTLRHRRQKAGVVQIASAKQLQFMHDLAAGRGITDDGLQRLCYRMIDRPRVRTTNEASKVIEAIKAMNRRDEIKAAAASRRAA